MEVPIVATDVGGTRELAWPNAHALLVPRQDPAALAAGVEAVVADPAAARVRAAAARTRIETDLSFEARTRHLEDIYAALIERRRCA
jgi:glycosyltransferase involved in cell wall biosynthesis